MTVVILEDAAEDMESGRRFYESRESGIGDYSLSPSFPILIRSFFMQGFTACIFDFTGCCRSAFRLASIMKLRVRQRMFMQFSTCAVTLFGFVASYRGECSEQCAPPNSR